MRNEGPKGMRTTHFQDIHKEFPIWMRSIIIQEKYLHWNNFCNSKALLARNWSNKWSWISHFWLAQKKCDRVECHAKTISFPLVSKETKSIFWLKLFPFPINVSRKMMRNTKWTPIAMEIRFEKNWKRWDKEKDPHRKRPKTYSYKTNNWIRN